MAHMIPPALSDEIKSAAERRIFDLLRGDPETKDWIVLHSLGLSRHETKRYGELDFVILVPDGAIVCLEVKGGRISCRDGIWETLNRYDEPIRLKESPFQQAQSGMFALRKIIEERAEDGQRLAKLAFGYGVVLPDTDWNGGGTDHESWQIFDRSFVGPISLYIKGIVANNADVAARFARPTARDVARLRQFLRPDFESKISPIGQVERAESEQLRLTEEQYQFLDALEGNDRLVVEGAAGTGKTLLALEAARRAAAQGKRVLLLCYNRLLGQWIAHRAASFPHAERITAGSFHYILQDNIERSSCASEFKAAFANAWSDATAPADRNRFYREDYALYALDAASEGFPQPYDLLLIDEGQDLVYEDALAVLDHLVRGGLAGGRWMLFADFNRQAIFAEGQSAHEMRAALSERSHFFSTFRLTRNCRNTRRIGRETALMSGFEQMPFSLHTQEGASVDYRFWNNNRKQRKVIGDLIGGLLDEGFAASDIVLLSPSRLQNSCLSEPVEELQRRGISIQLLDHDNLLATPLNTVMFATLHAFKGLERRAVIVIGVDKLNDESFRAGLYVAMSRPTARLFVLLAEEVHENYNELVQLRQQWQSES